jgi:hypothetical protein
MTDLLWFVGAVLGCTGLFYLAWRIEPHWVAKDGTRFLTTAEPIDYLGRTVGRRREVRAAILPDGGLMVSRRSIVRSTTKIWRIEAKSPRPPNGKELYLLREVPSDPDGDLLALRVPAKSRIVPSLDALTPRIDPNDPRAVSVPPPDPGSRRWGRRADRR